MAVTVIAFNDPASATAPVAVSATSPLPVAMAIGAGTGDSVSAFSRVPPSAKTDRSIVASTTSQVAAPANATRSRLIIRNLDAAIVVNVNLGAAATNGIGSLPIAPGGLLELTGTNQALNIIAVSGSPSVTIWEF